MRMHIAGTRLAPRDEVPVLRSRTPERRWLQTLLLLAGIIVLADALIGEQSLSAGYRARQDFATVGAEIESLREQNDRLRHEIRGLREDPATIEFVARKDLGLARRGELLFVLK